MRRERSSASSRTRASSAADTRSLPTVYDAATQGSPGAALLIRTADSTATAGREAARLIHDRDPKRPVTQIAWLTASAAERVAPSRLNATLFGGFAVLALTIAAIGVGGVLAFSISERTREFGIRMALGAEPLTILRGVLGEGLILAGAGVVIGVLGALFLSRFLAGLLFEVTPFDTLTFAAHVRQSHAGRARGGVDPGAARHTRGADDRAQGDLISSIEVLELRPELIER